MAFAHHMHNNLKNPIRYSPKTYSRLKRRCSAKASRKWSRETNLLKATQPVMLWTILGHCISVIREGRATLGRLLVLGCVVLASNLMWASKVDLGTPLQYFLTVCVDSVHEPMIEGLQMSLRMRSGESRNWITGETTSRKRFLRKSSLWRACFPLRLIFPLPPSRTRTGFTIYDHSSGISRRPTRPLSCARSITNTPHGCTSPLR